MQDQIVSSLGKIVKTLASEGTLGAAATDVKIEARPAPPHIQGDYSTNLVMALSKYSDLSPEELATKIIKQLKDEKWCDKAEFIKPGFINFDCAETKQVVRRILEQQEKFGGGVGVVDKPRKILIEYVSANPTGPLHTGHGRAAALGSSLANILRFAGHQVDTEFYVNDWGRQMNILTASLIWRVLEWQGLVDVRLPQKMYQGDYLVEMAEKWLGSGENKEAVKMNEEMMDALAANCRENRPQEDADDEIKEKQLDRLIESLQQTLGGGFEVMHQYALREMVGGMQRDLEEFGVEFNNWYHESSTAKNKTDVQMIEVLKQNGNAYMKDEALWFSSSKFGDDKDRVLVRSNGKLTYFGSDIAYHHGKYERGYDTVLDILGADHHGYINRIKSSMTALGHNAEELKVVLLQLVFLVKDNERISMSTRAGQFTSLSELTETVGKDATRFFFLMYKSERELNFDIDLARSKSKENPVYYVQYAHARICRIFEDVQVQKNWAELSKQGLENLGLLAEQHEKKLISKLNEFSKVVKSISDNYEAHLLVTYLRDLAAEFHSYYNAVRVLDEGNKTPPRLCLCYAVQTVIKTGLGLIGVTAPVKM